MLRRLLQNFQQCVLCFGGHSLCTGKDAHPIVCLIRQDIRLITEFSDGINMKRACRTVAAGFRDIRMPAGKRFHAVRAHPAGLFGSRRRAADRALGNSACEGALAAAGGTFEQQCMRKPPSVHIGGELRLCLFISHKSVEPHRRAFPLPPCGRRAGPVPGRRPKTYTATRLTVRHCRIFYCTGWSAENPLEARSYFRLLVQVLTVSRSAQYR